MGIIDRLNDTSIKTALKRLDEQQDFDFRLMEEILDQYTGFPNSDYEKRIRRLHMREMALSDEERISPDTYGCDCIFLRYFVNGQMEDDFDLIARDFLKHEYQNLGRYQTLKYLEEDMEAGSPNIMFQNLILNLMFNAYQAGSDFARAQFLYLYKKYYRKEYNQLKRFNRIKGSDALDLSYVGGDVINSWEVTARVLTIARMNGVAIDESCILLYLLLDDWNKELNDAYIGVPGFGIEQKYMEKAAQLIRDKIGDEDELIEECINSDELILHYAKYFAFPPEYVFSCELYARSSFETYCYALALYIMKTKREDFSAEEIHLIAALYRMTDAFSQDSDEKQENLLSTLNLPAAYREPPRNTLYKPEEVILTAAPSKKPQKSAAMQDKLQAKDKISGDRKDPLQQEIDALRVELHRLENNEKALRDTIAQKDKIIQEQDALIQEYKEDQDELTALRNHVYSLTQDDTEAAPVSFSAMKAAIAFLRIVVIGGHDNWTSKMKQEFPDWTFIRPGASGTIDKTLVKNADKVYFFTDTISHSVYYRYVQIAREQKVPFGYIHGVNVNMNVAQIYRELSSIQKI